MENPNEILSSFQAAITHNAPRIPTIAPKTGAVEVSEDPNAIDALINEIPDAEVPNAEVPDAEATVQTWQEPEQAPAGEPSEEQQVPEQVQEQTANPELLSVQEASTEEDIYTPATSEADLKGGFICKAIDFYPNKEGEWTQTYPCEF
jgi:hypothetical protein